MAKLYVNQSIQDNTYIFTFELKAISEADSVLLAKYGEPDVDFGGTFSEGELSFTTPSNVKALPSDFPVTIRVDVAVTPFDTDTANKLALYRSTMEARIVAAFTALRNTTDGFTGEFVTNI